MTDTIPFLTIGQKEAREARRRYITAALRVKYQAIAEIGKLLEASHISEDEALDMFAEVREIHFR